MSMKEHEAQALGSVLGAIAATVNAGDKELIEALPYVIHPRDHFVADEEIDTMFEVERPKFVNLIEAHGGSEASLGCSS